MSCGQPLFERGNTFHEGATDSADYGGVQLEGQVTYFDDIDPSTPKVKRSGKKVKAVVVRNVGAAALLPGDMVTWATGYRNRRVDGKSRTTAVEVAGMVDDHLPAAGVAVGDLFYLIVDGPGLMNTPLEGNANNVFTEGQILYALTAATSGATTAGRPVGWGGTFTATQTTDGSAALIMANRIGRAMSAATTGNTNAKLLVDINIKC